VPHAVGRLVRAWPWLGALVPALVVDLLIGAARHFDFTGIEGFSTVNYGWLTFTLVGGVGTAWRLARPPAGRWTLLRVFVAPIAAFVLCFVLVTLTALVFLPHQSLHETVTTDAPGRSVWLAAVVAGAAVASECVAAGGRALRRRARRGAPTGATAPRPR
jgi:hypothetical protein